jgi:hypothetical protein
MVHGCTVPQGSVPIPTRALNNEVAYGIMEALDLAFDICLTGLRSAAHLNGREGVIHGPDPANNERWTARLNNGTCVSVKAANFVHVYRGNYTQAQVAVSASVVGGSGLVASGEIWALQLRPGHQLDSLVPKLVNQLRMDGYIGQCRERGCTLSPMGSKQ